MAVGGGGAKADGEEESGSQFAEARNRLFNEQVPPTQPQTRTRARTRSPEMSAQADPQRQTLTLPLTLFLSFEAQTRRPKPAGPNPQAQTRRPKPAGPNPQAQIRRPRRLRPAACGPDPHPPRWNGAEGEDGREQRDAARGRHAKAQRCWSRADEAGLLVQAVVWLAALRRDVGVPAKGWGRCNRWRSLADAAQADLVVQGVTCCCCYLLLPAATGCNMLLHAASRCFMLLHAATCCYMLLHADLIM